MFRIVISLLLLSFPFIQSAQDNLLDDPEILRVIHSAINANYAWEFSQAKYETAKVRQKYPDHPVVPFLMALNTYWANFPMIPDSPESDEFNQYIMECLEKAKQMLNKDSDNLEGIFFDLFGRAFYAMYWSDNGKSSKVFPHLNTLYRNTIKGFKLKESFPEFYFSTGLYNYYREAYPEKHPIYKPIARIFSSGNMSLGISQLEYCARHAVYVKAETKYFLSHIYMNYEADFTRASEYASELYKDYPNNYFYTANYLETLLFDKEYSLVPMLLQKLDSSGNRFAMSVRNVFMAMYIEKKEKKPDEAIPLYNIALEKLEYLNDFGAQYRALAYMGLHRCYAQKGLGPQADSYFKMAKSLTNFDYILNDR